MAVAGSVGFRDRVSGRAEVAGEGTDPVFRAVVGSTVRCVGTFESEGVRADPAAVRFLFRRPSQDAGADPPDPPTTLVYGTDAALVHDEPGRFHVDLAADEVGTWRWRWESDAPGPDGADEGEYRVLPSEVTP